MSDWLYNYNIIVTAAAAAADCWSWLRVVDNNRYICLVMVQKTRGLGTLAGS